MLTRTSGFKPMLNQIKLAFKLIAVRDNIFCTLFKSNKSLIMNDEPFRRVAPARRNGSTDV